MSEHGHPHRVSNHSRATRRSVAVLALAATLASCGGTSTKSTAKDNPSATSPTTAEGATTSAKANVSSSAATPTSAAPTTTAAQLTITVAKKVWYGGFEIAIENAVFTASPQAKPSKRPGDLVINATVVNLTDKGLNFGYLDFTEVSLDTKGETTPTRLEGKSVPEGGRAKVTITTTLPDFDEKDAVLLFGGPKFNQAKVPLGAGAATTIAPTKPTVAGTSATPGGLSATITSAQLAPFPLTASGGGEARQAKAGEMFLKLNIRIAYSGTGNNAIFNMALVRPDGLTNADEANGGFKVIDPGQQSDGFIEFAVPSPPAGKYVFRFSGSQNADKAEIAFTL